MKSILKHIERAKEKPHHERKRLALTWAGASAGGIALVWLAASLSTGAFYIQDSSLSQNEVQVAAPAEARANAGASAGAAAVGAANQSSADAPAGIKIVDSPATSTAPRPEQTVIPF